MEGSAFAASKGKKTIFVGGFADGVNEQQLVNAFVAFGDIMEVSLPHDPANRSKHRNFAFITYSHPSEAQDAIDNYDLNELPGYVGQGKVLKVNLAKDPKSGEGPGGKMRGDRAVWQSEEWLQQHALPLDQSMGEPIMAPLPPGAKGPGGGGGEDSSAAAAGETSGDVEME